MAPGADGYRGVAPPPVYLRPPVGVAYPSSPPLGQSVVRIRRRAGAYADPFRILEVNASTTASESFGIGTRW